MHALLLALLAVGGSPDSPLSTDAQAAGVARGVSGAVVEHQHEAVQYSDASGGYSHRSEQFESVSQLTYLPSFAHGWLARRRTYRYPPIYNPDYPRPYDYRKSFDYPWGIGPRPPACLSCNRSTLLPPTGE